MSISANSEMESIEDDYDVIDLTLTDDDDDEDDENVPSGSSSSTHAYNTRSTQKRAIIKLEQQHQDGTTEDSVGLPPPLPSPTPTPTPLPTVTVTPEKHTAKDCTAHEEDDENIRDNSLESSSLEVDPEDQEKDEGEKILLLGKKQDTGEELFAGAVEESEDDHHAGLFANSDGNCERQDERKDAAADEEESSDDDVSLFGDSDEGKKNEGEEEFAGVSEDDNASLFSDSDGDGERQDEREDAVDGEESSDDDASLFKDSVDGDDDDDSRFSGGGSKQWMEQEMLDEEPPPQRPEKVKKTKGRAKRDTSKFLTTTFYAPPEERLEPECYYFAQVVALHGKHLRKITTTMSDGLPQRILDDRLEERYEIVWSDVVKRNANGAKEDKMGTKYYKSFYFGLGKEEEEEELSLSSFLLSIADFESLAYESSPHKVVSRFKLLFSTACRLPVPGHPDKFCFFWLPKKDVVEIKDDSHLGCGFIDPEYLSDLLGSATKAKDVFAIQVRLVGPSSIGIAKGMLVIKEGMKGCKIQVPKSMIKVGKSVREPAHGDVALIILTLFPSEKNKILRRLFDNHKKDPTVNMVQNLAKEKNGHRIPCSVLNVLRCKGVDENRIEEYNNNFMQATKYCNNVSHAKEAIKHSSLVGVSDPTGCIPSGLVFLTGFGKQPPSQTFLTRSPCTEGRDGIIAKVATFRDIRSREAFQFLNELPFGAVVFALGADPLPPKINDGDLDGDLYQCIWDSNLIEGVKDDEENLNLGKTVYDEFVGTEFQHLYAGKEHSSQVVKRLGGDLYQVATGPSQRVLVELTKQQITQGKNEITKVLNFRKKSAKLQQFECEWSHGGIEWTSTEELKDGFGDPPQILKDYVFQRKDQMKKVLPRKFYKWLDDDFGQSNLVKIVNHRKKKGKIEVLCEYDDGSTIWEDLELNKKDSKIFVGAYAYNKKLVGQPGWEVESFWLDEAQDLMCKSNRAMELSNLTPTLHTLWKKSFKENGPNHDDTVILGRAYKESNDIAKHGIVPKLPLHLHHQLSKKKRTYLEVSEGDVEYEAENE